MNRPINSTDRPVTRRPATDGAHSLGAHKKKGWLPWLILALLLLAAIAIWGIVHNHNNNKSRGTTVATAVSATPTTLASIASTAVPTATVAAPVPASTTNGAPVASAGQPTTVPAAVTTISSGVAGATPSTSAAGGASGATIPPALAPTAPLAAGGQDLVAISSAGGSLTALNGQTASGQATVQSVVSDEGFWVGTSTHTRVFVLLSAQARGASGESPFQVVAGQTVEITGSLTSTVGRIPSDVSAADGLKQLTDQGVFIEATSLTQIK